jgi:hypothetical protein
MVTQFSFISLLGLILVLVVDILILPRGKGLIMA